MKALIEHYLKTNLDEILEKSLMNCHCVGLHSIMLSEVPGKTIRLYITDPSHELWQNSDGHIQSIAFHPHHCDLTLHCIFGAFVNLKVGMSAARYGIERDQYLYQSKVTSGEMQFKFVGKAWLTKAVPTVYGRGESVFLKASDIHSVFCSKGTVNAWLVYEGKDDPNYVPYCWTNKDLTESTAEGLYQKMDYSAITGLLKSINI